jgi:hypothetical protein
MRKYLIYLFLVLLFSGCMDSTKVAPKIASLGLQENSSLLEEGREVYLNSCTKCHNAVRITRYSRQQWQVVLPEMIKETKLTILQEKAVTAYIEAVLESVNPN